MTTRNLRLASAAALTGAALAGCGGGRTASNSTAAGAVASPPTSASATTHMATTRSAAGHPAGHAAGHPARHPSRRPKPARAHPGAGRTPAPAPRTTPSPTNPAQAASACRTQVAQARVLTAATKQRLDALCGAIATHHATPAQILAARREVCRESVQAAFHGSVRVAALRACDHLH